MESLTLANDYFIHEIYDDVRSDEDIICTSCARGRSNKSYIMPKLPNYKIVHKKKLDFKTALGLAEHDISKTRTLGRGRARKKVVPQSGDAESSADERIKHVNIGFSKTDYKTQTELRKPRSKPKMLIHDFPLLPSPSKPVENVLKSNDINLSKDTTNLQDMAKFLLDSWRDEVKDEGQFDDAQVLSKEDNLEKHAEVEQSENSNNNSEVENINSIQRKTDDYIKRLNQEVDNIDLDDFENIEVSESSNVHVSELEKEKSDEINGKTSSPQNMQVKEVVTQNGVWYSSEEVYVSNSGNVIESDISDDTSVSLSTESLLPYDNLRSALSNDLRNSESDYVPNKFDLTLPPSGANSQENICNSAIPSSSPDVNYSTLSISKSESERTQTSVTSDKDESENKEKWTKLSRKEKKKKRDALRARVWHEKYSNNEKSTDTDPENDKCNAKINCPTSLKQNRIDTSTCSEWRLKGESVIQLDGLPMKCDISALQDLIGSYGTVIDFEKKTGSNSSSVRFRLNNVDACEMVVSCLDDTDIFPDSISKISCIVVQ